MRFARVDEFKERTDPVGLDQGALVRIADQSDVAASMFGPLRLPAVPAEFSACSTTRLPARSISNRWRSASISSMESATKYLNGHTDVTAGVLAGSAAMIDRMEKVRRRAGTILDPYAAYALGRGLKTLAVRVERQNASALPSPNGSSKDRRGRPCITQDSRIIPTTRSRDARCADSAG